MFSIIFSQFRGVATNLVILELVAVISSLLSVLSAAKESILVFPLGIICTCIYTYILWVNNLLANMLINIYYTLFSIYGIYLWARSIDKKSNLNITLATKKDYIFAIILFIIAIFIAIFVYYINNNKIVLDKVFFIDIISTAIFFVAMMFMVYKKIENWILWSFGDILSVFLYFYSKLYFSSLLYLVLTIIAILSYFQWKKNLNKDYIK